MQCFLETQGLNEGKKYLSWFNVLYVWLANKEYIDINVIHGGSFSLDMSFLLNFHN